MFVSAFRYFLPHRKLLNLPKHRNKLICPLLLFLYIQYVRVYGQKVILSLTVYNVFSPFYLQLCRILLLHLPFAENILHSKNPSNMDPFLPSLSSKYGIPLRKKYEIATHTSAAVDTIIRLHWQNFVWRLSPTPWRAERDEIKKIPRTLLGRHLGQIWAVISFNPLRRSRGTFLRGKW